MRLPPFILERYLAEREFVAPLVLCASDCESRSLSEILDLEPGSREKFEMLWLGYTEAPGHPELRKGIASLYETIRPQNVLTFAGAEEAIFTFMNVVLGKGDHAIIHWPCYQSLFQVAESAGCEITRWEADPDDGWRLSLDALKQSLRPNTKAVILNSPHNPTGYLMKPQEIREVARVVENHGAILFVDEVYKGLEYDPGSALTSGCDLAPSAVTLGVMSKSLGLAGLRIGWLATRNTALLEKLASYKDYTSICNSAPSEFLATIAIRHKGEILNRNRGLIADNLGLLDAFFSDHADSLSWVRPKAGCIIFPKWKKGSTDRLCESVLKETGVLLAPSSKFAFGDSHFRIGYGRRNFPAALAAFRGYLQKTR